VLRALAREPRVLAALEALLEGAAGRDARYDRYRAALLEDLGDARELRARDLTQRIALAAQASLLLQHGPTASCEAFIASRLAAGPPAAFGTLPRGIDCGALMARVLAP
jgi:putative acyl-CoA dehydrogenase